MHCRMDRLNESKAVKGEVIYKMDIYWVGRLVTVHM